MIAVLFCKDGYQHLGLRLDSCPFVTSPSGALYRPTTPRLHYLGTSLHRIIHGQSAVTPQWRDIYIAHLQPTTTPAPRAAPVALNRALVSPFRINPIYLARLHSAGAHIVLQPPKDLALDWKGCPPYTLCYRDGLVALLVRLGRCCACSKLRRAPRSHCSSRTDVSSGLPWATVERVHTDLDEREVGSSPGAAKPTWSPSPVRHPTHDCERDHISGWSGSARILQMHTRYGQYSVYMRLAFVPSLVSPTALEVHLESVDLSTVLASPSQVVTL